MAMSRLTLIASCALLLVNRIGVNAETIARATEDSNQFSGTTNQRLNFDPHDDVPSHYWKVRVAHAALMSAVWLVIFPIGGILPRLTRSNTNLIMVHAVVQMIGFWTVVAAAGMGIWMANQIDQLTNYHALIGMILLALLCVQPATEIINHRFYHINQRVIIVAHVHIWLGRALLVAGVVQGGLGFLFAASFRHANVELWPRVAYGLVAAIMWIVYMVFGVIYPEIREPMERRAQKKRQEAPAAPQQTQNQGVNGFLYGYSDRQPSQV